MHNHRNRIIYLDNHATTCCDPMVIETMQPFFSENFGNPSSNVHELGRLADSAIESSRAMVAHFIGAHHREIIFTSGATESNNLAILGLARGSEDSRKKIITSPIEHKSVLNATNYLEKKDFKIVELPVDSAGKVKLDIAAGEIDHTTLMVSIQAANNEIGTIQAIKELVEIAHDKGAFFHCDAAQALGKIPVNVRDWGVDMLSMSAHKMYGPKGIGALYLKDGPYNLPIEPILWGGEQEHGLRSGTLNVPGIVGFGKACELCEFNLYNEEKRITNLRDKLEVELARQHDVTFNGAIDDRLPGNSNITLPGLDAEALIINMPYLAISTGSACTSGAPEPSQILMAIGLSREEAYSSIRIGLGRFSTLDDIELAIVDISDAIKRLTAFKEKEIR